MVGRIYHTKVNYSPETKQELRAILQNKLESPYKSIKTKSISNYIILIRNQLIQLLYSQLTIDYTKTENHYIYRASNINIENQPTTKQVT